jgi:dTDP-D-glucose 4,6-dehydratase
MIPTRRIDSNKIEQNLNWKATTPLHIGLKKAHDWYLNNKEEFK